MVEVKALYHFLDKNACRNRMQGEVFKTTEEYAEELRRRGLVAYTKEPLKKDVPEPADPPTDPPAKSTKAKGKKK